MNVTINVDETLFKDVIEKELKAFDTEELHEIIKDLVKQYLMESNTVKSLFVTTEHTFSGNKEVATDFLKDIVRKIDISNDCNEIKDKIVEEIKCNSKAIVTELFAKAISRTLCDSLCSDYQLESIIHSVITQQFNRN